MKGSYILLLHLKQDTSCIIGKRGPLLFSKGYYVYVGSALNGIEQRIQHHFRKHKKFHWHIDYLLNHAEITNVYYKENNEKEECMIASQFTKSFSSTKRFGCSDCACTSHLFSGTYKNIVHTIETIGMKPYPFDKD